MTSFAYTARIAPIGKDISTPGDAVRPVVLDETTWQAWCEEPWHVGVWAAHERSSKSGRCMYIRVKDGWYEAEFLLDRAIERHLPEGLPVGQPMSVGVRIFRESLFLLQEISIVPKGGIRGAEIISRRERKAPTPSSTVITPKPKTPPPARVVPKPQVSFGHGEMIGGSRREVSEEARRWAAEAKPGIIRRPNIGQVTAVGGIPLRRGPIKRERTEVISRRFTDGTYEVITEFDTDGVARAWELRA